MAHGRFAEANAQLDIARRLDPLALIVDAYQHHDHWMLFINVDPEYDVIRSDPRFQAVIHRLGVG